MTQALDIKNISRSFGGVQALNGVSFSVQEGARHLLIGPNGAGKTTLFNIISGQITPDSGRIHLFGEDITNLSTPKRARRGLGRTYQINNIFPNISVEENVYLAFLADNNARRAFYRGAESFPTLKELCISLLEKFGFDQAANQTASSLSHGDQRKLEIMMALATDPSLLLLDEPTAGLSSGASQEITDFVKELPEDITTLMIEHDLDVAFEIGDKVTVLHLGEVIADGPLNEVRRDETVKRIYFGKDQQQTNAPA